MKKNCCDNWPALKKLWATKTFLSMRLTFYVLLLATIQSLATDSYAQATKLNLTMKNTTVREVLSEIEDMSEFYFLYNSKIVNVDREVSVNFKDKKINEALDLLFKDTGVSYNIVDRQIVLSGMVPPKTNSYSAQQKTVTGNVTDDTGQPLPGVTVVVKGTTQGTVTNADGEYTLSGIPENATLQFSFVGMRTQEVVVGGQTNINAEMAVEAVGLEEVVAVGYGTQRKVNVIGSVTSISSKEISTSPVSSVSNALAGRLPGVIVQQRSGEPGNDAAAILVRGKATFGTKSPLVVIDGIPGRDLNSLEPNDIESITILKDASAAIYGARAANGVILVRTKMGNEGKPKLNFEHYYGISTPTMLPEMADAGQYAEMIRETQSYRGVEESNMTYSLDDIEKYKSGEYPWTHPNSDWFGAALKKYTGTHHTSFSINGGTKNINYFGSFGNQEDDAIYKDSDASYKRYNLRGKIDATINKYLSINLNIDLSQENTLSPPRGSRQVYYALVKGRPTDPVIYPNGFPAPYLPDGTNTGLTGTLKDGYIENVSYRSQNTIGATFNVPKVEGLTFSGYYSYDMYFSVTKDFRTPWINYNFNKDAYLAAGNTGKEDGSDYLLAYKTAYSEPRLTDSYGDSKTKLLNFNLAYRTSINKIHNIDAFVAYEQSEYFNKGISAFRRYFLSESLPYLFAGGVADQSIGSYAGTDAQVNYFGRLSYNYKEKYLLQFTFRRDGSLRFPKDNRWGNFPSLIAGWRISNEDFWNIPFVNYFKLRGSWGKLGNDQISAFQYLSSYAFSGGLVLGPGKSYSSGLVQSGVANPNITWEVANMYNLGFDSYLLNNKLQLNLDVFYQRREKILITRSASVPNFTGVKLPDENFGIVDNRGFEIEAGYSDKIGDWVFGINGNFSFVRNKIIEFDEPANKESWQTLTGNPMGSVLLYNAIGIFSDANHVESYPHVSGTRPGDIIIEDYNGDDKITSEDRILYDITADPEITFGVNLNLGYKNWKLNALIQGVGKCWNDIFDQLQGTSGNYFKYDAEGRWTPDNITANKPRAWERTEEYWRTSYKTDYTFHRGDYARMKNLTLSYTIPKTIQNKISIMNAELYFSGQNLFLIWSKSKLMDPELTSPIGYPLMKVYSIGTRITF